MAIATLSTFVRYVCVHVQMCVFSPTALADQEPLKCSTTDLSIFSRLLFCFWLSAFTMQLMPHTGRPRPFDLQDAALV